jgi:ApaG protein
MLSTDVKFHPLSGLRVVVEQVSYDPTLATPPAKPFAFAYTIVIHNDSEEHITLFGRKWILDEDSGTTQIVEGDGIVGKFPSLAPGQTFRYQSYHTIDSDTVVTGAFFGQTQAGKPIGVAIPRFQLTAPMLA